MSGIDRERLLDVKRWMEREIRRIQVRRANAPMFQAIRDGSSTLMTDTVPDMLAGPQAELRASVLKLEKSMAESDERFGKADEDRERRLAQAQSRTAMLKDWLEILS